MPDLLNSYLRYARGESGRRSPWAILNVASALVGPVTSMRNAFYDRGLFRRLDPPLPVVSVGNLCNGGTNKTPMVDMIARMMMDCGLSVGIVSRGYGGAVKSPLLVGRGARVPTGPSPETSLLCWRTAFPKRMSSCRATGMTE